MTAFETLTFSVRAPPVFRRTRTVISTVPCPRSGVIVIQAAGFGSSHEQNSWVSNRAGTSPPAASSEIFAGDKLHVHVAASCETTAR